MRTFQSNALNDLVIGSNGNLNTFGDINAIAQTARQFMQARRGEMIHKADEGVPFDPVVWGASPNVAQFEAVGRARLLQAPDVLEVLEFTATQNGDILTYTATIRTTAGEATING